jgi:hypothetical protein
LLLILLAFIDAAGLGGETIKLRVTAEQANIREKPDITSAILLQVQEGSFLEAEKKEGEWYAVRVEQESGGLVSGYVHESLVTPVEPPKPEEKAAPVKEKPVPEKPEDRKKPQAMLPALVTPPPQPEERPEHFSLSLWWGARYAKVGDLNAGADGLASYYAATLGAAAEGDVTSLHLGYVAGGELQLPLGSGFYFALGAEYFSSDASSTVTFGPPESQKAYLTTPGVQAIPVSLSILFYPVRFLNLRAGLDYSLARCTYLYRFEESDFWQKWKGRANSGGLGYHFGVGADWRIFSHLSLVAEALYRHSRVKGFEGEGVYQESAGDETSIKGKLYFFRAATSGDESVPVLFLREKVPTEPGVSDVREAELDLTGLSLRAGLKITF